MAIEVVKPGLATTVQDLGREGYYHVGIPPSGALDQYSLIAGNLLLGNPEGAAGLEFAYMGPELVFDRDVTIAVTGGDVEPRLDGEAREGWTVLEAKAGQKLGFGHMKAGARGYIAVAGGISVEEKLGSRSTYALGGMGGFEGRPLAKGDRLSLDGSRPGPDRIGTTVPEELRPGLSSDLEIRVVMGLYDHLLTAEGRASFLETAWKLTPVADRVGFRYEGGALDMLEREQPFGAGSDPSNIVDAPYPIGSIQVPGGLEPIVLHRDAVSGGGYAMVATVISADMDTVAQSAPGTMTKFVPVTLEQALEARGERNQRLDHLRERLGSTE